MSSFVPNTIILNRFRLNENLSTDLSAGHQTWSVTDMQSGQSLIARIHNDGHIDWFNDNRQAPKSVAASGPVGTEPRAVPVSMSAVSYPEKRRGGGWVMLLIMLAGVAVVGYFNQEFVLKTYYSWTNEQADTAAVASPVAPAEVKSDSFPSWKPDTVPESVPAEAQGSDSAAVVVVAPDESSALSALARQRIKLLVEVDPGQDPLSYKPVFSSARDDFKKLVESKRDPVLCDSLYIVATDRASQYYRDYKRKNDLSAKISAIEWFLVIQAIKPSPGTAARINQLHAEEKKPSRPKKETYFGKDPELKL